MPRGQRQQKAVPAPDMDMDLDVDMQSSITVATPASANLASCTSLPTPVPGPGPGPGPAPSPLPSVLPADGSDVLLERALINNAELRANALSILNTIRGARPQNTALSYDSKQEEFRQFCLKKQYHDGDTVTEDKLLLFLVEEVVHRPLRVRSKKAAAEVPLEETRLSWRSVRSYITAVTDLYRAQKALGRNTHPSPREDNAREYIKSLQRRDAAQEKANYADKGRDTLLDGYTEAQLRQIAGELWGRTAASPECHLRTLVDILLGHYMLTRGGDRRAIEISDLFTFEFPDEGLTQCMPLILTTRAGKKNQHGRLETAGALRSQDPLMCMLSALAFYLLFRWDLTKEPFPDFRTRPRWYDIRLIKGTGAGGKLSYSSQRDWVIKAFSYAGIVSNKKTHIGRSSGAKTAELKGVSEAQIQRAGRWNPDQMIGCYLNSLPREFMRSMAGHPKQAGGFNIPRAQITPPESLLSMIWPDLDQWKGRFGPGPEHINDLAATGVTNLLLYLREVILQDSVFLIQQFPKCPLWNHRVFQHPEYLPFARQVSASVYEATQPGAGQLTLLTQAVPALTEYMQGAESRTEARIADIVKKITANLTAELQKARSELSDISRSSVRKILTEGIFQFHLTEAEPGPAPGPGEGPAAGLGPGASLKLIPAAPGLGEDAGDQSQYQSARSSTSRSTSPTSTGDRTPPAYRFGAEPPKHCMSRAVKSVEGLWHEWTVGLPGQPSIAALDSRWGSRWRARRRAELQWYSLRLEVIREIRRIAQTRHISEEAAMQTVAMEQRLTDCGLDLFCKRLRAGRKTREAEPR